MFFLAASKEKAYISMQTPLLGGSPRVFLPEAASGSLDVQSIPVRAEES
jgi:hypothetical protein